MTYIFQSKSVFFTTLKLLNQIASKGKLLKKKVTNKESVLVENVMILSITIGFMPFVLQFSIFY